MNISINKDIEKYQESVVMGLTARQLIFSIASVACGGAIVLLTYRYVSLTGSAYIAIPVVAPLALNGFYSYQGMSFTQMFKRKLWFAFKNRPLTYISEESEKTIKRMRMDILGRRKGYERATYRIHNIPFVVLGATILWFGWFGFNAGSALKADGLAAHAFMTSAIASASALLSWMLLDIINDRKTTLVGASTGLVIGLVAITPGAGFVPIWSSFIIGALVSPICYYGVILIKKKLKIDDALDAFGCHGIGGIWGGIATGIFGKSSINPVAKWDGLVYGEWRLFVAQIEGILITIVIAVVGTLICVAIVRIFTTLRVTDREERIGLDISQHGENAYPSFNGMDQ